MLCSAFNLYEHCETIRDAWAGSKYKVFVTNPFKSRGLDATEILFIVCFQYVHIFKT